ncbi:MAG: hypothetical protein QOF11_992 [Chloroflexota bacterium]|jgi:hypothetical protein|nr:hypothetical protein [Chloroflexota bacterium]
MAVFQGARPRPTFLPPRILDAPSLPRRRARTTVRARRRPGRVGILLGGIALAFLLAFFSLVQSVRVSATGYEIDRLANERSDIAARRDELIADLNRLGRGPAIRKVAIDLGLDQLAEPLVVNPH